MHSLEHCNTLIVEDDLASSDVIGKALARQGCHYEAVGTVGAALIKLEDENLPNTVILDLRLPDADGTVILRRLRRENPQVKVAVVTGVSDPESFSDFTRFAPDAVFKKPVDLRALIKWLEANCIC